MNEFIQEAPVINMDWLQSQHGYLKCDLCMVNSIHFRIFDTRTDVLVHVSNFLRQKKTLRILVNALTIWAMFLNTGSGGVDIFEVKLATASIQIMLVIRVMTANDMSH